MAILTDILRQHLDVDLDFDWTDGNVVAMLVDKTTWTPSEADDFVASVLGAGGVETSGTRTAITTPGAAVSGVDHVVYFTGDPIVYPGVLLGETFDTLVLFRLVTNDADSYIVATFDLGAQTGDGSNVTINPAATGYVRV